MPTIQILLKKCCQESFENEKNEKCHIYALIIVPSRELVAQTAQILQPICELFGFNLLRFIGGNDKKKNIENQLKNQW